MIDFRHETFRILCEIGSYTKTAEALHLTQPAITQHVKYLEKQYGGKLFTYKNRTLTQTERGAALYGFVVRMSANEKFISNLLNSSEFEKERVSFGATLSIGEYVMPKILKKLYEETPEVSCAMIIENTQTLLEKLTKGEIDFALIEGIFDSSQFESRMFSKERFIPVCSPTSRLANKSVEFNDLLKERIFTREKGSGTRDVFEGILRKHNLTTASFASSTEIGGMEAIKSLVSSSLGISFMYEIAAKKEIAHNNLVSIMVSDFCETGVFSFVFLKDSFAKDEYLKRFEQFCRYNTIS